VARGMCKSECMHVRVGILPFQVGASSPRFRPPKRFLSRLAVAAVRGLVGEIGRKNKREDKS
jgi:hypothetical protein